MVENTNRILIAVDVQPEFGLTKKADADRYWKIVNFIRHEYRTLEHYDAVFATVCKNHLNHNFVKSGVWTDLTAGTKPLDFEATEFFVKYGYGLSDYDLYKTFIPLAEQGVEFDVIGYNTDCCVLKVALDLFDRGAKVRVLSEYCYSSSGEEHHQRGVEILKDLIGTYLVEK